MITGFRGGRLLFPRGRPPTAIRAADRRLWKSKILLPSFLEARARRRYGGSDRERRPPSSYLTVRVSLLCKLPAPGGGVFWRRPLFILAASVILISFKRARFPGNVCAVRSLLLCACARPRSSVLLRTLRAPTLGQRNDGT